MANRRVVMEQRTMVMDTCVVSSSSDTRPSLNELRAKVQMAKENLARELKNQEEKETELRRLDNEIEKLDAAGQSRWDLFNMAEALAEKEQKDLDDLKNRVRFLGELKENIEEESLQADTQEGARLTESFKMQTQFVASMLETVRISDRNSDRRLTEAVNQEEMKLNQLKEESGILERKITEASLAVEEIRSLRAQVEVVSKAKDFVIEPEKLHDAKEKGQPSFCARMGDAK